MGHKSSQEQRCRTKTQLGRDPCGKVEIKPPCFSDEEMGGWARSSKKREASIDVDLQKMLQKNRRRREDVLDEKKTY